MIRILVSAILFFVCLGAAQADPNNRAVTSAERALVDRFDRMLGAVLDQFRTDDWDETVNEGIESPSAPVKPLAPLQINEFLERTYDVRQGSARWNSLIEPKNRAMGAAASPEAMARIGQQMQALMHVHVDAEFNVNAASIDPPLPGNPDLHLPGVAASYRVAHPNAYNESGVILLFGRWRTAQWDAGNGAYRFTFVHPRGSLFIENIEVRIGGAQDRVDELLRSVDWRKVNDALAP